MLAHEIGHHVQKLLGISYPSAWGYRPDCFADIWANSTAQRNLIEQKDVEAGIRAVLHPRFFGAALAYSRRFRFQVLLGQDMKDEESCGNAGAGGLRAHPLQIAKARPVTVGISGSCSVGNKLRLISRLKNALEDYQQRRICT